MELGVNDISKYPGFVLFLAVNVQGPLDLEVPVASCSISYCFILLLY